MNLLPPTELPAREQSLGAPRSLLFSGPHSPGTLHRHRGPVAANSPWAQLPSHLSAPVTANPWRTAASGVLLPLSQKLAPRLPCSVSPRTSRGRIQHQPWPPFPPRSMGQQRWVQWTAAPWACSPGALPPPHPSPLLAAHPCPVPAVLPAARSLGSHTPPPAGSNLSLKLRPEPPIGLVPSCPWGSDGRLPVSPKWNS